MFATISSGYRIRIAVTIRWPYLRSSVAGVGGGKQRSNHHRKNRNQEWDRDHNAGDEIDQKGNQRFHEVVEAAKQRGKFDLFTSFELDIAQVNPNGHHACD